LFTTMAIDDGAQVHERLGTTFERMPHCGDAAMRSRVPATCDRKRNKQQLVLVRSFVFAAERSNKSFVPTGKPLAL